MFYLVSHQINLLSGQILEESNKGKLKRNRSVHLTNLTNKLVVVPNIEIFKGLLIIF